MTLSLLSISHEPVSLPVTPVQARADILHWHLLPKHGNLPLTKGARIYESKRTNKVGISQIKTAAGWSGGKVSGLIYVRVETCWISPIHFSAMPLLWQPVCKYLLTLTRAKQCHCTSRWFSLHVWAEYACVRHWNIHTAVVCIPGNRQFIHVRVYVRMSFVDVEVACVLFWSMVSMSGPNPGELSLFIFLLCFVLVLLHYIWFTVQTTHLNYSHCSRWRCTSTSIFF